MAAATVPAGVTPAQQAAPASGPTPTPAASQAAQLPAQLARPIFTLASAGRGDHVMTVHVSPDLLGPVTVRAHVSAEGVRVELFAPTDAGRDALRSILPDLRKDLSGAGLSGSLDLSSENQPSAQSDDQPGRNAPGAPREERTATLRASGSAAAAHDQGVRSDGLAHSIDLIA